MRFLCILFLFSFLNAKEVPLHVGMELAYPPFEMICPDGDPCGISVDMAKELGNFLTRDTLIENIAFIGLIPSLKSGKIDLIISSLSITPEREKSIDFSIPYAKNGLCLLINVKSTIQNIEDADSPGKVIVVKSGTTGESYAKQHLTKAAIRVIDKEAMCVLEVIQGKADAFIYDQLSVYTHWQKNQKTLKALLTPFHIEEWAIGVRKGNEKLLNKVNAFIKQFKDEGGFNRLGDKYLFEQKQAFKKMNIPFIL